jgi:hypothetical protein
MPIEKRTMYRNKDEQLTGVVQEKKASDIEERSARAMDKIPEWSYTFLIRVSPLTGRLTQTFRNLAGEYEIDFIAQRGNELVPILIDGEVSHFLAQWQKIQDEEREAVINKALSKYGARPAVRVPFYELPDQNRADVYFRRLLQ